MTTLPPAPPDPAARRRGGFTAQARKVSDTVPTKWLVTGIVAVLLAGSAVFGGLNDAPAPPLTRIQPGDTVTGQQLAITPERAVLIDGFPEEYIEPESPGGRLLVVVATVENEWTEPVTTSEGFGASDNLRVVGVPGLDTDTAPFVVVLLDDGSQFPDLQPGVPMELGFIWEVPGDALADGDTVRVDLYDKRFQAEGFVTFGARFVDPVATSFVELPADDVGAGVEPEAEPDPDSDTEEEQG
ncbi:MAG: hypothetical protein Q7T71_18305 [Herbiconiux sp.]|nr:hypothetical protein [Herbiconiux sp.]